MTPEERLLRIEKVLDRHIASVGEAIEKQNQQIDKHNEAIKGLIVVARTCVDSIQAQGERNERDHDRMMAQIDKLREAQTETAEKRATSVNSLRLLLRVVEESMSPKKRTEPQLLQTHCQEFS